MAYLETLRQAEQNPQAWEQLYQEARRNRQTQSFRQAVHQLYTEAPDQLLPQAWFYRLDADSQESREKRGPNWRMALPLSLLCGLSFWLLTGQVTWLVGNEIPLFVFLAAPLCAIWIMLFLTLATPQGERTPLMRLLLLGGLLASSVAYVTVVGPRMAASGNQVSYLSLAIPHLILLAWIAVGRWVVGKGASVNGQFAFLLKSFEAVVVGGLFLLAGALFTGLSFGLFDTLGVPINDGLVRLFVAGGGGLIPILAVALSYDPQRAPQEQNFQEGISHLISTLMRLMLPLALLLLGVYLALIPLNFHQPFQQREVLIVYNLLLFAVIGLLMSATPFATQALSDSQARWLRRGLLLLAGLAVLISVYALTAIGYRTWADGFTPNRVTVLGWNVLNIGLLTRLLVRQWQSTPQQWLTTLYGTFALGAKLYCTWAVIVIVVIPWLFMWVNEPIQFWR
ncbi:MAG: hypothetical protein KF832_31550 [Caldilineaceae bacterium]|nr:hypothetical protein [Caldilineaceae bacterium]